MLHIKAERLLRHRSIGHFVIKMNKFCRHRKIGRHKVNSRPMDFLSKYFWIYQIYGRQSTLPLNLQWPVTNLSLECATEACNGCSQMHFKNKCYSNHLRRSLENFFDNFFFVVLHLFHLLFWLCRKCVGFTSKNIITFTYDRTRAHTEMELSKKSKHQRLNLEDSEVCERFHFILFFFITRETAQVLFIIHEHIIYS